MKKSIIILAVFFAFLQNANAQFSKEVILSNGDTIVTLPSVTVNQIKNLETQIFVYGDKTQIDIYNIPTSYKGVTMTLMFDRSLQVQYIWFCVPDTIQEVFPGFFENQVMDTPYTVFPPKFEDENYYLFRCFLWDMIEFNQNWEVDYCGSKIQRAGKFLSPQIVELFY